MSKRRVQLVLLCEDLQHRAFLIRFLKKRGWSNRDIRAVALPHGRGSGEQFVRNRFPEELEAIRRGHVNRRLIVMIDGDSRGRAERLRQLNGACEAAGTEPLQTSDRVVVLVPTWNIETWLAYLGGQSIEETEADYARLQRERDCQRHVDALDQMCRSQSLRQPAPPSLEAACEEFRKAGLSSA